MKRYIILCYCVLLFHVALKAQEYKNLVFKGGGIRGIAYCGALQVMEKKHITDNIEKVAGTSVGAITGALFSAGYTSNEINGILKDLKIHTFNDGEWFFIGGQKRLRKNFGWYKGMKLEKWLSEKISEKTGYANTTFKQLHELHLKNPKFKDLYVTASNLTLQKPVVFSWQTYPDLPINIAVRASASIPMYYGAVFIDSLGNYADKQVDTGSFCVYADGGLLNNYPITVFNEANEKNTINKYTLGLKLERPEQIEFYKKANGLAPYTIKTFKDYIAALYNISIEQMNQSLPHEIENKNTIYINNGNINPRVRHLSDEQKAILFEYGKEGAENFFNKAK